MKKLLIATFFLLGILGGMYIMTSALDGGEEGTPKAGESTDKLR